MIITRQDFTNS